MAKEIDPANPPEWYRPPKPFPKGHLDTVKHGAYSKSMVSQRAQELLADLQTQGCAWLTEFDAMQLDLLLQAKARYDLFRQGMDDDIENMGLADALERKKVEHLLGQERNLMKVIQDLGLDPTGRARLLKDLGLAKEYARQGARDLADRGAAVRRERGR